MAGRPSSSEPSGNNKRTVYCTGSTLGTRSWASTKSTRSTKSSVVVQGVNGSHDGRTSMPWSRNTHDGPGRVANGMAFVEVFENRFAHRLERRNDEGTAGFRQLRPGLRTAQNVLHLGRAVEGQVRVALVDGRDDPAGVERGVEKVGVGEAHVAGTGGHQLVDIGYDCSFVHGAHPAVVHDRHRTVPAAGGSPGWPQRTRPGAPRRRPPAGRIDRGAATGGGLEPALRHGPAGSWGRGPDRPPTPPAPIRTRQR